GAMLTHRNLATNAWSVSRALRLQPGADRILLVLPMFHAFAATAGMLYSLLHGIAFIPLPRFDPVEVAEAIAAHRATVFMGVPAMFAALLRLSQRFTQAIRQLKFCISGGAPLPAETLEQFEKRFGVLIYEGDGPTECSPVTCVNPIGGRRKIGSVGRPVELVEMAIMDDRGCRLPPGAIGEICVRGPNVMKGYWKRPEATRAAFFGEWFRTGDIGRQDEDGYFYIMDRRKDMLIVNGMNVYPRMIEEVLHRHPDVAEAAIVGMQHAFHGEIPVAWIVPVPGRHPDARNLRRYCAEHLGQHEIPRRFEFADRLPRTPTGKVDKGILRDQLKRAH
ncbi:MAG TPA: long-chain fatty acid--CoA ligase, partial [Kiritimatiellae bacterium]|nr:long-chain fatty acid--CoA ligase [Kiritimatiellia bacterium]